MAHKFSLNEKLLTPVTMDAVRWIAKRPFDSSLNVAKAKEAFNNKPSTLNEALDKFAAEAHAGT